MNATPEQEAVWLTAAGIEMSAFYMFLGSILLSLFLFLMIKVLKGSIKGWSKNRVDAFAVGSRLSRLTLLFSLLLYLVTP